MNYTVRYAEKWSPEKWSSEKWSPEKWSSENLSLEKFPSKIVLRQKNARKFQRLFHFYQLIPLHTQKNVWRSRRDPTYVPNCRTLKKSRKICCRVLGFYRLITSEHSTPASRCSTLTPRFFVSGFRVCCRVLDFHRLITSQHFTHTPRCSTPTPRFFVSEFLGDHFSRGPFFRGPFFSATIFPGDHFSGDHFFRELFFRGPFFRDSYRSSISFQAHIRQIFPVFF